MDVSRASIDPETARPADADDGAVFRDQGGQSGLPAVLPDGRLLRALLRRRRGREPGARHRADQARQARGRGHPHVRRADRARRRLSQPADRARPSRRGLRADRGPGGGEEARRRNRSSSATSSGSSRRARSPRSGCSSRAARACSSPCSGSAASDARWTYGLAALDLSTGAFSLTRGGRGGPRRRDRAARAERDRRCADGRPTSRRFSASSPTCACPLTPLAREAGDGAAAERRVCEFYGVETLDGFGAFTRAEIAAAALALAYVKRTQFEARPALSPPTRRARGASLEIDPATRANLELTRTLERRARGLAARDDRPHRDAGRRAAARRAAREPADRPGRDQRAARLARFPGRGRADARRAAPRARRRARFPARARRGSASTAAARATLPRSATASRRPARWRCILERRGRSAAGAPARLRAAPRRLRRARSATFRPTLADDLPLIKRDGGFVRAGASAAARRSPRAARREPARHRRDAGVLRRGDGRPAAQDQAQQLSRLLHRDAAGAGRGAAQGRRSTRPSSIARPWRARCASPPTRSSISRRRSPRRPTGRSRSNSTSSSGCGRPASPEGEALRGFGAALAEIDVAAALAELAVKRDWTRPRRRRFARLHESRAAAIRWSRRR